MLAEDNEIKIVVCFCPLFASFFPFFLSLERRTRFLKKKQAKNRQKK